MGKDYKFIKFEEIPKDAKFVKFKEFYKIKGEWLHYEEKSFLYIKIESIECIHFDEINNISNIQTIFHRGNITETFERSGKFFI